MDFYKNIVKLVILIAFSSVAHGGKCHDPNTNATIQPCKSVFESLLACNSRFLDQAMLNSDPFTVCTNPETSKDYNWTVIYYDHLMSYHDPNTPPGYTCASQYLSKNRMELVINTIQYSKNVWAEANCDNCYESSNEGPVLSADTQAFNDKYESYKACVKNASSHSKDVNVTCQMCVNQYINLTDTYDVIKTKFGYYKTCFDIQDRMNKTQTEWSGTFGCCHEKKTDLTMFFIAASVFFVILIGFYIVAFVMGMKKPGPLDANDIIGQPHLVDPTQVGRTTSTECLVESDDDDPLIQTSTEAVQPKNDNLVNLDE